MGKSVIILILHAMVMYLLVLGAHSLRRRWGPVHFYALIGGITAVMSWVTDAGLTVGVGGVRFVVGSTVFYTSLLLGVFVIYAFDGPRAARIAISTVMGISILMPLTAAALRFQMGLGSSSAAVPVPLPSLRINTASVVATFLDLIFLAIAWEFLGKPGFRMGLWFRTWLTLLGVMWLDVLLFATGAFAGNSAYLSIMQGTLVSRFLISLFALPFLYGYLYWQSNLKGAKLEQRPVLAILGQVAEMEVELSQAQKEIERRKKAEAALRESKALLSATGEMAKVGGWKVDVETLEVRWTEQTHRIHEVGVDYEPSLEEAMTFFHPADREKLRKAIQRAIDEGKAYDMELRLVTAKGKQRWVRTMCKPRVSGGQTAELKGTVQDVTDRKLMEQQLRRQERLAAVGQMAAGLAHDFRNRINAIMLGAQMALNGPGLRASLTERLDAIIEESRGIADLVQQILDFSSQAMINVQPDDLAELIHEAMNTLRPQIPSDVRVSVDVGTRDYVVNVDADRIRQALSNLVQNACDAMPEGGELRVALSRMDGAADRPEEWRIREHETLSTECVCVSVSDTGTGMTEEVRQHLFEPFFTTKDVDEGTGLGLAQVYGIVRQHGGTIDIETELGKGTKVYITLPLDAEGPEEKKRPSSGRSRAEEATILLVERHDALRTAGREVLESFGYRVLAAKSGREALATGQSPRWIGGRSSRVDLIIAELTTPGMDTIELVRELRKTNPEMKAVAVSHQVEQNDRIEALHEVGFDGVMWKPFSPEDLAIAVRDALDSQDT